jgi:hypothetical protein
MMKSDVSLILTIRPCYNNNKKCDQEHSTKSLFDLLMSWLYRNKNEIVYSRLIYSNGAVIFSMPLSYLLSVLV